MIEQKIPSEIEFFGPDSKPFDKSYGEWTVKWWQWALGTPRSINPVVDETGKNASVNQPTDVWFLAGKFGDENKSFPQRQCTVPAGRAILFPIINCEANPLEYPELKTEEDILDHVSNDVDTVVRKECYVNGKLTPVQRVASDPQIFPVTISKDNSMGVKNGGSTRAAADGYWVFLKPLPKGDFVIKFAGSCEKGRLNSGASYRLRIV
jgi:hypothetical protein